MRGLNSHLDRAGVTVLVLSVGSRNIVDYLWTMDTTVMHYRYVSDINR